MPREDQSDEFEVGAEEKENVAHQGVDEDLVEEDGRADAKAKLVEDESPGDALQEASLRVKKTRDELKDAKAEAKTNLDGWQRAKADYVNLLKRTQSDVAGAKEAGVTKAVEALLPAYDAIERAKEHGDVPEGFQAIVRQLEAGFASLGLVAVGEVGEQFNPELHEAYGQDATDDKAKDDVVTAVLEKGWKQGERVIRPAKVRVAHYQ